MFRLFKKKSIEQRLEGANFEDFIEGMADGVIIGGIDGVCFTVNKAQEKITGYTRSDLVGKNVISVLVSPDDRDKANKLLKQVLLKGSVRNEEVRNCRKDGSLITTQVSATLIKKNGIPKYIIVVVRDMTKQIQDQKKISELNDLLKLLNTILRHDVLNDLTVFKSGLDLFFETKDKEALDDAMTSLERSKATIKEIGGLEATITNNAALEKVDVSDCAQQVTDSFKDIEVTYSGKAYVEADVALKSVIENLVRNAKMHGEASHVHIQIGKENNGWVDVRVSDNGSGIRDEIKPQLFEQGFTHGVRGNTGLGLYIVKKTIERYQGEISVDDNHPSGAEFTLRLKAA